MKPKQQPPKLSQGEKEGEQRKDMQLWPTLLIPRSPKAAELGRLQIKVPKGRFELPQVSEVKF